MKISFTKVLLALGGVLALVVLLDLSIRGMQRFPADRAWEVSGGDEERGRQAILKYGCGACHVIPGIRGANGRVGPKLEGFRDQVFIAGMLANTPEQLILWIQDPRGVNPGTAMPDLLVTEQEARDIAFYLYANP